MSLKRKKYFRLRGAIAALLVAVTLMSLLVSCSGGLENEGYNYDLEEYVELGDISVIEVSEAQVDRDVTNRINSFMWEKNLFSAVYEGGIMDYDRVKVDYACFIDGLSIDAFGAQDAYIFIGSGMMIDGFEEALIGMTLAEVRDIKLRFPDEYYSDLGGKEVTYSVTVKEICRVNEITDDVCKANTDYDSVEDMRSSIKRLVAAEYAYDKLFDEAKITKYPEAEYGRVYEDVTYIGTLAEKQKLSIEEYLKKYGDQFAEFGFFSGMTEEEYLENCDEYTKGVIKDEMVIYYLLRRMDVSTGGRAYRQMKERLLSEHKVADVANYEDLYGEGSFNSSMRYNLLLDALYDRVVFK